MQIKITTESPDTLKREGLALGFFMDERPPRGACGLVDWRMNGLISREIAQGHIAGTFMEKIFITSPSRLAISKILLIGLGALHELTCERLYLSAYLLSETMDGIGCNDFVFNLPAAGRCHLGISDMAEAMVRGCFDFLSKDIEKWATASTGILAEESHLEDVITGLQNFKSHVRDVSIINIA